MSVTAILALDLGTRTGWALAEGGRVESGAQVFDVKRGESPGMRFLRLSRWLEEIARVDHEHPHGVLELVVYEAAHHRGGAATAVGVGMSSHVLAFCARHGIEHQPVHTATIKKFATGNGRGDKAAMIAAVQRRGWAAHVVEPLDDNHADALALLHYALEELVPNARCPPRSNRVRVSPPRCRRAALRARPPPTRPPGRRGRGRRSCRA